MISYFCRRARIFLLPRALLLAICLLVSLAVSTLYPFTATGQTLTANGRRLPLTLSVQDQLSLYISYDERASSTASHDWWLALVSSLPAPNDVLFYNGEAWGGVEVPVYQRTLGELLPVEVLSISGIPTGTFTFYFGVEANADRQLDVDLLEYDSLTLTITDDGEFNPAACGIEQQLFDTVPLDSDAYFEISPLGATNPSGHTFPTVHTYIMLTDNQVARNVYSPGYIQVLQINQIENLTAGGTDYALHFSPCQEVTAYFDHLSTLDSAMLDLLDGEGSCRQYFAGSYEYRFCSFDVQINYGPGDIIGNAGGSSGGLQSAALDFGLRDTRIEPLFYVNPQRLVNPDQRYVACPYDYYVLGSKSEELQQKLGNARQDEPVCGSVSHDVAGTAQGRWYLQGSSDFSETDHVALVPSSRNPDTVGVLSIGNADIGTDAYYFDYEHVGTVNRRFDQINESGYCFQNLRSQVSASAGNNQSMIGVLLLRLEETGYLRLEKNLTLSACPGNANEVQWSDAAVFFQR